jgi:hypothetical protein
VIPVMIVFGVILGRWWRWSIPAGGVVWAVLLLATHSMVGSSPLIWFEAIVLGIANTAVGAVLFLLASRVVRAVRPVHDPAAHR